MGPWTPSVTHALAMSFDKVNDGDTTFSNLSQERNKGGYGSMCATPFRRLFGGRQMILWSVRSGCWPLEFNSLSRMIMLTMACLIARKQKRSSMHAEAPHVR